MGIMIVRIMLFEVLTAAEMHCTVRPAIKCVIIISF